jgi:hypothetical protein
MVSVPRSGQNRVHGSETYSNDITFLKSECKKCSRHSGMHDEHL